MRTRTSYSAFCFRFLLLGFFWKVRAEEPQNSFYDILQISRSCTSPEIKKAYRRLSLTWHPDRYQNVDQRKEAEKKFLSLTEAYHVISDPIKRRYYDSYGDQFDIMREYFEDVIEPHNIRELYRFEKRIQILFKSNVDKVLNNSKYKWIITFYHPNCTSCRQTVPVFSALAEIAEMSNDTRVATMNCAVNMNLCREMGIRHLGHIAVFPESQTAEATHGQWESEVYDGPTNAASIFEFAKGVQKSPLLHLDNDRLLVQHILYTHQRTESLGVEEHHSVEAMWIAVYTRSSCPPCRQLKQELRGVAREFKNTMEIVIFECDREDCDVPYFPFIKLFTKRRNQHLPAVVTLEFDVSGHPGSFAIKLTGYLLRDVFGLSRRNATPAETGSQVPAEPGSQDLAEPGSQDLAEPGSQDLAEPGSQDLGEPSHMEDIFRFMDDEL